MGIVGCTWASRESLENLSNTKSKGLPKTLYSTLASFTCLNCLILHTCMFKNFKQTALKTPVLRFPVIMGAYLEISTCQRSAHTCSLMSLQWFFKQRTACAIFLSLKYFVGSYPSRLIQFWLFFYAHVAPPLHPSFFCLYNKKEPSQWNPRQHHGHFECNSSCIQIIFVLN